MAETVIHNASASREHWLKERRKRIGASEIAAVMGLCPYKSPREVWYEKTNRVEGWAGNDATHLGSRLESALLDEAEDQLGTLARDVQYIDDDAKLAATLDAMAVKEHQVVETKTAGLLNITANLDAWGEPGSDQVPDNYALQVQTQMLCSESEVAHLFALISGRGIVRYRIDRNDKIIKNIRDYARWWWGEYIESDKEPDESQPMPLDLVKRIRREPEKTVTLDDEALKILSLRQELKMKEKKLREQLKEADAMLIGLLGDAEGGDLPDGSSITYLEQTRSGYEVKPTKFRTLRIKKAKR